MTIKLNAKQSEIMRSVVDRVIQAMADGTAPWQKPWATRGSDWPSNLDTGKRYRGLNALYLMLLSAGYGCDYWVGFKQARNLGGNVRKGEQATQILAPMMRKGEDKASGETFYYVTGFRVVNVFNVKQCDGLELPAAETTEPRTLDAPMLDEFIALTGATVRHDMGSRACYIPSQDEIHLPARDDFHSAAGYYGTVLHELVHWTGHKTRLDRLGEKNKRGYAFEELIAELGAYYASEKLGCPNEAENHASYLEGWLKALQNDHEYLWKAAAAAEKAADYLIAIVEAKKVAQAA